MDHTDPVATIDMATMTEKLLKSELNLTKAEAIRLLRLKPGPRRTAYNILQAEKAEKAVKKEKSLKERQAQKKSRKRNR